jgi:GNAT superfamily N-acetyltransferase
VTGGPPPLPAGLTAHRLQDRPDLLDGVHRMAERAWPEFMRQSTAGEAYYDELGSTFADCAIAVVDATGDVVARVLWIPFAWDGSLPLPDRGWDWVIEQGIADRAAGTAVTAASALEISIDPPLRGAGLSGVLLGHMRAAVAAAGLADLFAPVRPSHKHEVPAESIHAYVDRVREDGLPHDPWLRVHVRAGGEVLGPCPESMHIEGTVEDWQAWTGLSLAVPGDHVVPQALAPVESDGLRAVYTEPNVWVRHRLRG